MAPKCLVGKGQAAVVPPAVTKPKAKAKARTLTARKCQAIISRLQATEELPVSLRQMMTRLARGLAAKGKRHICEEAGTSILGKAVRDVEAALQRQRSDARAEVDGADAEKDIRSAAQMEAESELSNLKQAVVDKKAALVSADKAIDEARGAVQAARAAQRSAETEVKGGEGKKRRLETVERESYEPLRDTPASSSGSQKRLLDLRKFGRDHGFHKELLTVLPAVLRKQPDKRRTFDGLCLHQLEVEFARQAGNLDCALREAELLVAQRAEELEQAQLAVQEAKDHRREGVRELAAAESALEAGKRAVVEARRHLKRQPADARAAQRRLAAAEARVEKFKRGPLAAFQKAVPEQAAQPMQAALVEQATQMVQAKAPRCSPADIEEPAPEEYYPTEEELDEDEQDGQRCF